MAKAIQVDFPVRDHKAELQMRLAEAPTEHAAAILELLELLDVLHERNVSFDDSWGGRGRATT